MFHKQPQQNAEPCKHSEQGACFLVDVIPKQKGTTLPCVSWASTVISAHPASHEPCLVGHLSLTSLPTLTCRSRWGFKESFRLCPVGVSLAGEKKPWWRASCGGKAWADRVRWRGVREEERRGEDAALSGSCWGEERRWRQSRQLWQCLLPALAEAQQGPRCVVECARRRLGQDAHWVWGGGRLTLRGPTLKR